MPIMSAASPVEIEAKADSLGLSPLARAGALAFFHDLTSREELAAITLPDGPAGTGAGEPHEGARWPAHRLLFGTIPEMAPVLAALRGRPDAAELAGASMPEDAAPGVLFLPAEREGLGAVLLACADTDRLEEVLAELGQPTS